MANVHGKTPFGGGQSSSSLAFDEFVPPSAWTEDSTCHYLLVDLPGFKRQELKLQVDNQTHIAVSGERQVRENKYKRFEQSYELPKNADVAKITGKLDGEILYISVPKKVEQEHEEIKHGSIHGEEMKMFAPAPAPVQAPAPAPAPDVDEDEDENDNKSDTYEKEDENDNKSDTFEKEDENDNRRTKYERGSDEDWGQEANLFLRLAIEKLRKNKGIVATAIVAFSLGVLVTQKFQSGQ